MAHHETRLFDIKQTMLFSSIKSRTTIYAYVKRGLFPAPHYVGNGPRWREDELLEWVEQLPRYRLPASETGAQ